MSAADQLRAAKALIDTPEKWTKNAFARGKSGKSTTVYSRYAVCFCSLGALSIAAPGAGYQACRKALDNAASAHGYCSVAAVKWTDDIGAATPALALVSACLKARSRAGGEHGSTSPEQNQ